MSNATIANESDSEHASLGSLRDRLREATRQAHADLDRHFALLDLTSLPVYRRFLEASAAALVPLEDALMRSDVQQVFPDWDLRSRGSAIRSDLASLGGVLRPLENPRRFDLGGLLGTMYVLEGSRLGGKFLLNTVASSGDPRVAGTTKYLNHGAGRRFWPSFLSTLESVGRALASRQSAIDGAQRAFDLFALAAGEAASRVETVVS
jgi:heme oxygenase